MSKDLNLQACVAAFEGYDGPLRLSQGLQHVGEAYHRNITRVTSLAMILPAVASVSLLQKRLLNMGSSAGDWIRMGLASEPWLKTS
jgi:hypothetical protein